MKKAISVLMAAIICIGFASCGSNPSKDTNESTVKTTTTKEQPENLSGEWEQSNKNDKNSYMVATITENEIDIYWYSKEDDSKSLYWAGSYTAPTKKGTYKWTSANNTEKTSTALLASPDATKEFTFENDTISYQASALGTTMTVELKKVK